MSIRIENVILKQKMENKIDHIGWLTDSIEETSKVFSILGYKADAIVNDDTQRCRICFIYKPNEVRVELVEPYEDNKTMQRMLKKQGCGPYHTCHTVKDIDATYEELVSKDFIPLFQPVAAPAFGGRRICYFFKQEIGYYEVVEE